jgi:aryl-alcohol dehydrogenase-like predicted oxidoreductase
LAQEPAFAKLRELWRLLQTIAQDHRKKMADVAIAWVLRQPTV